MSSVSGDEGSDNQSLIIGVAIGLTVAVLIIIAVIIIIVLLLYKKRFAQYNLLRYVHWSRVKVP